MKFFLFLISFQFSFQTLILPLTKTKSNTFSIPLCIGKPYQCTDFILSQLESDIKLYITKDIVMKDSTTKSLIYTEGNITLYTDYLYFNDNIQLKNVYITTIATNSRNNYIGLNRKNKDDMPFHVDLLQMSLIEKLYRIAEGKKVFYIDMVNSNLFIGDYPYEYYNKYNKTSPLQVKQCRRESYNGTYYNCKMSMIYFKKGKLYKYYQINENYATFDIGTNAIYVSKEFFDFLIENYFSEQIKEQKCEVSQWSQYHFIKCEEDYNYIKDKRLGAISFVIGKYTLKINPSILFSSFISKSTFFLMLYVETKRPWTFGYPLFNKYTVIFDDDKDIISFIPK